MPTSDPGSSPLQLQPLDRTPEIRTKLDIRKMFAATVPAQGPWPCLREIKIITPEPWRSGGAKSACRHARGQSEDK